MQQKWKYEIQYTAIGNSTHSISGTFSPPYKADEMFHFITDYAEHGSWADQREHYTPIIIETTVRDLDALTKFSRKAPHFSHGDIRPFL